jgi:crotonobetainyl-CoA:carnitine CoA-transferase CaiB-like acyl-CoA transferase
MRKILNGLKVIDLTQNVAGPFCTQTLGDLGADIVKIERLDGGDDTRAWHPPAVGEHSSTFLALNRNKSSVCVDIDSAEGRQVIRDLAKNADVLVHSMKPGSAERRGLGSADLRALNDRLVYCAISAFGSTGPLSELPGYDPLLQAFTGIMSTTGNEGQDPVRVGVSLIDMGTGMWAVIGILAALFERRVSNTGASVEASLLDTGISWMSIFVSNFAASKQLPRRMGSAMSITAPYELFHAKDGLVFIAAGNDRLFSRVCEGLDVPMLASDPRFSSNPNRVMHRVALHSALEEATKSRTVVEIVAILRAHGAPCSELNSVGQMLDHEQVRLSGMVRELTVDGGLEHLVVALPVKIDDARGVPFVPPPVLGADTDRLLTALGYDSSHLRSLRGLGAIR